MITDANLYLAKPADGYITQTRAICLAQNDLAAPTDGIGPYEGLWLNVLGYDPVSGLVVTVEHSDDQNGPFTTLVQYPPVTAGVGEKIVVAPIPFNTKNWLRLTFGQSVLAPGGSGSSAVVVPAAARVNALLTAGVDKFQ